MGLERGGVSVDGEVPEIQYDLCGAGGAFEEVWEEAGG